MATPSETQINSTHLGLLQQATEYSRKLVAQRQAEAAKLENEYNAIDRAGPRAAYFAAKNDPNADPAKVAELKAKYDEVKEQSADLGARLDQTNRLLADTEKGLIDNEARYEEAKALAPAGVSASSPTIGATSNDPTASATQNRVDSANTVPVGQQLNTDKTSVNPNTEGIPVVAEDGTLSTLKKNPETGELYNPVPPPLTSGLAVRNEDGSYATSRINPETGELYNPVPGSVAQGEFVPDTSTTINDSSRIVNSQTEADGTIIQTFADGAILTINPDGTQTFSSAPEAPVKDQQTVTSSAEKQQADTAAHGLPYDDEGNLMPGWSLDENNDPVWVGGDFVEPATAESAKASREAAASNKTGALNEAATSNAKASNKATPTEPDDWRVRLSLAPNSNYLYRAAKAGDILFPLNGTNGVLFPYTPQIQTSYKANYDPGELTHSNYKMYFYKNSSVDDVTITADFTAQDTAEANYMLAVIHFFKSATKMFYGQDHSPRAGTPPPLLYLTGFGAYQFDHHPLLLTNFTYNLPNDVDYIRAGSTKTWGGTNIAQMGNNKVNSAASTPLDRLKANFTKTKIAPGGTCPAPAFSSSLSNADSTYVPTKIQIQLSLVPVVTRKDISDNFSLEKYATGSLSRGSRRSGGGIW